MIIEERTLPLDIIGFKHKYVKRTGSAGSYQYYYDEPKKKTSKYSGKNKLKSLDKFGWNKHRKELLNNAKKSIIHEMNQRKNPDKEWENITDIKVFGSFATDKEKPNDVDIAIFVKDEKEYSHLLTLPDVDMLILSNDKYGLNKLKEKKEHKK